jgi:hypothetical protein
VPTYRDTLMGCDAKICGRDVVTRRASGFNASAATLSASKTFLVSQPGVWGSYAVAQTETGIQPYAWRGSSSKSQLRHTHVTFALWTGSEAEPAVHGGLDEYIMWAFRTACTYFLYSQPHPFGNNNTICNILLIIFVCKHFIVTLWLMWTSTFLEQLWR